MRRINLIVSEELRNVIVADALLSSDGIIARGVAGTINRGCMALLSASSPRCADAAIQVALAHYDVLKEGKVPKVVVYMDSVDEGAFAKLALRYSLSPRSRGYRVVIAVGLAVVGQDLAEIIDRQTALGPVIRNIAEALQS